MAEGLGGRLESFYFAFGETDAYVILDLPDNQSAAAASIAVNTAGGATSEVVVLLAPEEIDAAKKIVCAEMQGVAELLVPLVVDVGVGNSWRDAK